MHDVLCLGLSREVGIHQYKDLATIASKSIHHLCPWVPEAKVEIDKLGIVLQHKNNLINS